MTKPVYLALDVEAGSIDPSFSLLTAYFAAVDENFNIVADLDLKIKPNDGRYIVAAEGMEVNMIDIVKHNKIAITEKEAATLIYNFIKEHSDQGKEKLIPLGHNVSFDIDFVVAKTLTKKSWDQFVGYRKLDTGGIAMYLIQKGTLPKMSASLGTLAEYFKAPQFEAHTAKGDTHATIWVMKEMMKL